MEKLRWLSSTGEFTVKTLRITEKNGEKQITLLAANPKYPPIVIDETTDFECWGVVKYVIHEP